ncbi:serine/threonine-protein kinase [Nocardia sp. NPDC050712]|uniref:serine/threonine-protein kinase n=1 Tax=Nocardia sp. NPDC050712 TaxID=3155518 RepID=UPI0033CC2470
MVGVEGTTVGGYIIERQLGKGGMGTVYSARHPRLPRVDAVKILSEERSGDPHFRARFLREAEVAARLQHPNLVAVRDRGEQDGRLWIAMQYVEGVDVGVLITRGPAVLDVARAVHILTEAARGLDELHRAGLLHRDVKPANLLVAAQPGGPDRVLVTDFGIARAADDSTTLAGAGGIAATLAYAAPEQISGAAVDRRADVYALGATLYHMLAGTIPFPRNSPGSAMYAHLHEPPPRPSARNPRVPKAFDAVIARAMAKRPSDRYDSCGALAEAAAAALNGDRSPRRAWRGVLAAAAFALVLVLLGAGWIVSARETPSVAGPHLPVADSVDPAQWGAYAYMVEALPELLPAFPFGTGYQDLAVCYPLATTADTISLDASAPVGHLFCLGDRDPAESVEVYCNADRSPMGPNRSFAKVEGDQSWTRRSGSGHVFWGSDLYSGTGTFLDGKTWGVLEVYFNDPARNFCRVRVIGAGPTGTILRDRWWADAPL